LFYVEIYIAPVGDTPR